MSLKQTIESHPVFFVGGLMIGALIAGYNLHPLMQAPLGRVSISTDEYQKLKSTPQAVQVKENGVDVTFDVLCKGEAPYHVKEKYSLISAGDPASFVMLQGTEPPRVSWRLFGLSQAATVVA